MSRGRQGQRQDIIKREFQGNGLQECGVDLFSLGQGEVACEHSIERSGSIQGAKSKGLGNKKDSAPNSFAFHYNPVHHPARRCTWPGHCYKHCLQSHYLNTPYISRGSTRLRHCATSRKVAGSIHDGNILIFH